MPVITINGPIGAGGVEVGQTVAQMLNINYVDRLVLAEAAKLVKSPVGALIHKEQRVVRFGDRLARFLQNVLERSALSGISGEVYFGRTAELLPAETYTELAGDPSSAAQRLNDKAFIDATTSVVKDLAKADNVVIIGRGANMMLADVPGVVHVGLSGSVALRIQTISRREHLTADQARAEVEELEQARITFFRKFFKVRPSDPTLYHIMLNMDKVPPKTAAEIIVHSVKDLAG
ncbi:MAG: cytidylate kinase-like family protein [SAR202 cluster bacterium]|nr:cytidylate kinase-like family protein [SAR202 cluster bacterium]